MIVTGSRNPFLSDLLDKSTIDVIYQLARENPSSYIFYGVSSIE